MIGTQKGTLILITTHIRFGIMSSFWPFVNHHGLALGLHTAPGFGHEIAHSADEATINLDASEGIPLTRYFKPKYAL